MSKGEKTRARILEAGLKVACRDGLGGLSIGTLANDLALSKSGLFAHVGSKEALEEAVLKAAFDRFVERVIAPALARPGGVARLRAIFDNWLEWTAAPPFPGGCPIFAALHELDDRPGPARDRLIAAQRDWYGTLIRLAKRAVDDGDFRADLDTRQFTFDFQAIVFAFAHARIVLADPAAPERLARGGFESLMAAARNARGI
ncbi:TetR/AcrR family transcriptional regulator [Oceanibacterium hippocampi]|uniref:HTH tetR-type domain-containing protein n=1 Tax=Oceanibacterium hippocampi TaxID=745714 RepID=A0A1Y5S1Y9_9PROT|nr:TetR/AcrR family transcriptional regulator [Oceanibacterium hippocampi]SLN30250.1 hypothetical protein OCH7691_01045 [Oceanibacterium hippocampi]